MTKSNDTSKERASAPRTWVLVGVTLLVTVLVGWGMVAYLSMTLRSLVKEWKEPSAYRDSTPAGLAVWVIDDSTKVLPGDHLGKPHPAESADHPVRLEGARGETVAFQIVLASQTDRHAVDVELTPLEGAMDRLPPNRVQVYLEHHIYCPSVSKQVVSLGPGQYPDPLIPLWEDGPGSREVASPISIVANTNTVLWIDIRIPRSSAAGRYKGRLQLIPVDLEPVRIYIELDVLDFEIPATPSLSAWVPLYATRLWGGEALDELEEEKGDNAIREVLWRYFRMANEHRFITQIQEDEHEMFWDLDTGELLEADWSSYDELYGPVLDGRLFEDSEPPPVWKVGGFTWWGARMGDPPNFGKDHSESENLAPAHRRALIEYAREISRHFEEKGWMSKLFMYMIDEPDFEAHPNYPALIRAYGEALHASGTGIAHMVATSPQDSELIHGSVDLWATWGAGYWPRVMRERQAQGEKAWFYQQHEPFVGGHCIHHEGLGMRAWPWIAWRYGVDGIFLWAGNFWGDDPYRDPENWNESLLGNGVFFYPGAMLPRIDFPAIQGPVSSFRMKSMRRGLYDYEYFHLLEKLGGDPDRLVQRIVRSALNEREYNPYWKHPLWSKPGDWSHDPGEWDAVRREAAQEILERLRR